MENLSVIKDSMPDGYHMVVISPTGAVLRLKKAGMEIKHSWIETGVDETNTAFQKTSYTYGASNVFRIQVAALKQFMKLEKACIKAHSSTKSAPIVSSCGESGTTRNPCVCSSVSTEAEPTKTRTTRR
jgi:hypothetical protein